MGPGFQRLPGAKMTRAGKADPGICALQRIFAKTGLRQRLRSRAKDRSACSLDAEPHAGRTRNPLAEHAPVLRDQTRAAARAATVDAKEKLFAHATCVSCFACHSMAVQVLRIGGQ
jgi:hypothetical protein